ncbi:MAG: DUF308 domain-containing protein [Candidatus Promineifilaceae bacterium]|jgi:uncharacterized membrane protein HdeD (DUF308 family)
MAFWITLGRSFFALILGVALLFWPDKSLAMLGNFMGGFWIAGSLLSIRWGFAQEKSKALPVAVGILGLVGGLVLVSRRFVDNVVGPELLFVFIGAVAILTGLLHMDGRIPVHKRPIFRRTRSGVLLGIFEIVLGLILLFTPWQDRVLINYVALAWALIGSVVLFTDALAMRREAKDGTSD